MGYQMVSAKSEWKLNNSLVVSAPIGSIPLILTPPFTDLIVLARLLTKSASDVTQMRLSVDGGLTYFGVSGNYRVLSATGSEVQRAAVDIHITSSAAARSGIITIFGAGQNGFLKTMFGSAFTGAYFNASTLPINALVLFNANVAANFTSGTVEVFTR